jgi:hypothetical protein
MMATAMDADTARIQLLPIVFDMAADVVRLAFYFELPHFIAIQIK